MDKMDELTRRAAEELIKEGQEFARKRDVRYKEPEKKAPTLRPNTRFLKNVVLNNMSSNNNVRSSGERKDGRRDDSHACGSSKIAKLS